MSVSSRFSTFLDNIKPTELQVAAGTESREGVVNVLNTNYRMYSSKTIEPKYFGSWGKFTKVRPPHDVDVLFELRRSVYHRCQKKSKNRQSKLLQEVKNVLPKQFSKTKIKAHTSRLVWVDSTRIVPIVDLVNGSIDRSKEAPSSY